MPQSLLALLALALAALLGFSQQRAIVQSYEVRIRDEYAVAATGVLMHVLEMAAARSFDRQSTPDRIRALGRLPGVGDFTPPSAFGSPAGSCNLLEPWRTAQCRALEDLHGIERQPVTIPLASGRTMTFEISITVEYVDDADLSVPVPYPTANKRVTARAFAADVPRLGEIVRLERVVAFDPVKAEAEYEAVHGPLITLPL